MVNSADGASLNTPFLDYASRYLSIGGMRMHYLDEGSGPAVLLVHGNPTWCFFYRRLIAALAPHFRVIAPDHIGCGFSDHPTDAHFRAMDRVEHLKELLAQLQVQKFSVVMHDWGGPIGTRLAESLPGSVEKLVFFNTTIGETASLPWFIKLSASRLAGRLLTRETPFFVWITSRFGVCSPLAPEVRAAYRLPYCGRTRRTAVQDFVEDIPFSKSHPSFGDMLTLAGGAGALARIPVKIIWGMKDPCFHPGILESVCSLFPHAEIEKLDHASHLVLEDAPEESIRSISAFLSRASRPQERPCMGSALYSAFNMEAEARLDAPAAIVPAGEGHRESQISFGGLLSSVRCYERGLVGMGLRPGDKVLMLVPPGPDFLALSYAVMGRGAVPVYLDPGMGRTNLKRCIADAAPDGLIAVRKGHVIRLAMRKACRNLRFAVLAERGVLPGARDLRFLGSFSSEPLPAAPRRFDDPALVAFTSGGTGTPKGVIYTNAMIEAQLSIFRKVFAISGGKRDLPLLPIFSLFSASVGVSTVFAPIDPARPLEVDPQTLADLVNRYRVSYSFGSPTLWAKIAGYCCSTKTSLASMEKIFIAGAPVSCDTLSAVQDSAPYAEVYTPYGATEALPVSLISAREITQTAQTPSPSGGQGTLVGRPVPAVEAAVIEAAGELSSIEQAHFLPPLMVGEVIVKGPNVSPCYLRREEETKAAKIPDGKSFWHRMGDMGYLDPEGRLYFCGRKAHRATGPQGTVYSIPVERIFNIHPRVRRSALISHPSGSGFAVVIEPQAGVFPNNKEECEIFAAELRRMAQPHTVAHGLAGFYYHPSFPVDARHNAKIFRDRLAVWAVDQQMFSGLSGNGAVESAPRPAR